VTGCKTDSSGINLPPAVVCPLLEILTTTGSCGIDADIVPVAADNELTANTGRVVAVIYNGEGEEDGGPIAGPDWLTAEAAVWIG